MKDLPGEEPCEKIQSPICLKRIKIWSQFYTRFKIYETHLSTEVFSPFANEPVRERVAVCERLQAVSEEPMQSQTLLEKPPVTITVGYSNQNEPWLRQRLQLLSDQKTQISV